jgi:ABC-type lipoprotein release transport system permease subunit/ABC-type Zn uptake system ZnuABC Zn-binding protein ZnuA
LNLAFYIARRYLFAKKSHNAVNIISTVSVCGVVVATIAMICTLSVFNGFKGLTSTLFSLFDPDLKITPLTGKTFDPTAPDIRQIYDLPDIQLICETLQENALIRYGERQAIALLKGVSPNFNHLVPIDTVIIDGSFKLSEADFHYAVPGIGLASTLGVNAAFAHPLEICMPKRTGTANPANPASSFLFEYVHIGGVYHLNQPVYDEGYMLVSIDLMRSMLDYDREVTALELKLAPGADPASVKRKISQLAGENFTVQNRYEQQELSFSMIQIEKWVSYLMLCFILVLALFNVLGLLAILMIEKEADVVKLRTMGADDRLINRIFLFEGWMISLSGAVIGVIVGVALCFLQQRFGFIAMGETAGTFIIDAYPVEVEWTDVLTVFLTVISAGFLAVLYPVHRLGRKWLGKGTLACLLLPFLLTACGMKNKDPKTTEIAVTIEPLRYFAERIAGDKYTFFTIVPAGQNPESYDPSPREMIRAGKSRACFHIGRLGFEQNLVASIRENNAGTDTFDLSEGTDFHENTDSPHHLCPGHGGRDPHIWTSFKGARLISANIVNALSALDKENHDYYQSNYRRLSSELDSLENSLHRQLKDLSCRSFIIYHPALTYFSAEFGLEQYSIENEGKEPSPAFLKQLIAETKSANVKVVFVQMEFDRRHAEQIAREIGAVTVEINPLDYHWDEQIKGIAKALAENGKTD